MVKIYTDGSCRGNGQENSEGGWGVVVFNELSVCDYYYGEYCEDTTNNREELKAMLYALELTQTKYKQHKCNIYSDSAYVVNMCREWIWNWQSRGWTRAGNQPIENLDLVKQIYNYLIIEFHNFTIWKIKGHSGELGNEIADAIATNDQAKLAKIKKDNKNSFEALPQFDF